VFSRADSATDSERFYNSLLEILDDLDEQKEVEDLLTWWDRYATALWCYATIYSFFDSQVFGSYSSECRPVSSNWVSSKIKEKRAALKAIAPQH
jgi:hypothetical protein